MADDYRRCRGLASAVCVMLVPLAACATGTSEMSSAPAAECVAQVDSLGVGATLREAAGSYRLVLVTEDGDGTRRTAAGTLRLETNPPGLRRLSAAGAAAEDAVSVPLHGWAAIDLQPVGALEIGDLGSQDPLSPGVLVLEQRPAFAAPVAITLRLGSIANRRTGQTAVDGGYTALHVTRVEESGGFSGTWISGVHAKRVEGHFCAVPVRDGGRRAAIDRSSGGAPGNPQREPVSSDHGGVAGAVLRRPRRATDDHRRIIT